MGGPRPYDALLRRRRWRRKGAFLSKQAKERAYRTLLRLRRLCIQCICPLDVDDKARCKRCKAERRQRDYDRGVAKPRLLKPQMEKLANRQTRAARNAAQRRYHARLRAERKCVECRRPAVHWRCDKCDSRRRG